MLLIYFSIYLVQCDQLIETFPIGDGHWNFKRNLTKSTKTFVSKSI